MKYLAGIMFACIIACIGILTVYHFTHERPDIVIAPELQSYVDMWIVDCESHGIDVKDNFWYKDIKEIQWSSDINSESCFKAGRIGFSNRSTKIIVIESTIEYKEYALRALMYHELGHYVFDLEHCDCHHAIMNGNINVNSNYYESNWDAVLEQYFENIEFNSYTVLCIPVKHKRRISTG